MHGYLVGKILSSKIAINAKKKKTRIIWVWNSYHKSQ